MLQAQDRNVIDFVEPYSFSATPYTTTEIDSVVLEKRSNFFHRDSPVKLVCVGSMGVGKTCVVNRFCHGRFSPEYKGTIGVDFEVELLSVLNCPMKLQIWDTAGQERFRSIASAYYRGANVIVAAFDLTDVISLQSAEQWMLDAVEYCSHPLRFLLGCKRDLLDDKNYEIIEEKAIYIASLIRAEYWPCSAKIGINIDRFFSRVAFLAMERVILSTVNTPHPSDGLMAISLDDPQDKNVKEDSNHQRVVKSSTCSRCA